MRRENAFFPSVVRFPFFEPTTIFSAKNALIFLIPPKIMHGPIFHLSHLQIPFRSSHTGTPLSVFKGVRSPPVSPTCLRTSTTYLSSFVFNSYGKSHAERKQAMHRCAPSVFLKVRRTSTSVRYPVPGFLRQVVAYPGATS
jgi:hypothetical protein